MSIMIIYALARILNTVMPTSEQFVEIEDRLISGLGILQIPTDPKWRYFRIYVNVVRDPSPDYRNNKWNPNRGEFAKMTWVSQEYVYKEHVLNYEKEVFELPAEECAGFVTSPLSCLFQAVFAYLEVITVLVGGTVIPPDIPVPFEAVQLLPTQIQFACRDGCALQVVLQGVEQDVACPEGEPSPKEGDKPPNELPKVPPGESIGVSPPYDPPNDDGNTEPFPGDEEDNGEEFPVGSECQLVTVTFIWETQIDPPGNTVVVEVFGEVTDVFLDVLGNNTRVICSCRGIPNLEFCKPQVEDSLLISIQNDLFLNYELVSVVPSP